MKYYLIKCTDTVNGTVYTDYFGRGDRWIAGTTINSLPDTPLPEDIKKYAYTKKCGATKNQSYRETDSWNKSAMFNTLDIHRISEIIEMEV